MYIYRSMHLYYRIFVYAKIGIFYHTLATLLHWYILKKTKCSMFQLQGGKIILQP